jgi:hypothetical protein
MNGHITFIYFSLASQEHKKKKIFFEEQTDMCKFFSGIIAE